MNKKINYILVALVLLAAFWMMSVNSVPKTEAFSIGLIGGADGPTAIFLASKIHKAKVILYLTVAGISLIGIYIYIKKKNKSKI